MTALTAPSHLRDKAAAVPRHTPSAVALSGRQKAAIIVRLLLSEGGEVPLRGLPDDMQAALTEQIASMRLVDRDTLRTVVEEFVTHLEAVGLSFPGGIEGALRMLDGHISATAASQLRRLAGTSAKADPWDRIATLDADRLLAALTEESLEVGAVMLSKLAVSKAAELLGRLPGARARQLAYAVSQTGNIDPATVRQIGLSLASQLEAQPLRAFEIAPHERIGAILNAAPATTRDEVLAGLGEEDAGFATEVRKSIFTFADIMTRIEPRDVSRAIRGVDQATLVTALAGATAEPDAATAEFILANMSQRMAAALREEMAERGRIAGKEAEAAQSALVAGIRDLVAAGDLAFRRQVDAED